MVTLFLLTIHTSCFGGLLGPGGSQLKGNWSLFWLFKSIGGDSPKFWPSSCLSMTPAIYSFCGQIRRILCHWPRPRSRQLRVEVSSVAASDVEIAGKFAFAGSDLWEGVQATCTKVIRSLRRAVHKGTVHFPLLEPCYAKSYLTRC